MIESKELMVSVLPEKDGKGLEGIESQDTIGTEKETDRREADKQTDLQDKQEDLSLKGARAPNQSKVFEIDTSPIQPLPSEGVVACGYCTNCSSCTTCSACTTCTGCSSCTICSSCTTCTACTGWTGSYRNEAQESKIPALTELREALNSAIKKDSSEAT